MNNNICVFLVDSNRNNVWIILNAHQWTSGTLESSDKNLMNNPAASSGVSAVFPGLTRNPDIFLLDPGFRRDDKTPQAAGY